MDCNTQGFPVEHQFQEFTQTHVHWVGDAIQPSHPPLSPAPPAFNLSQHQSLFKWVSSSREFSRSVVSHSLQTHGLWHTRLPCPSPTPRVYSDSCPLSWWCYLTISSRPSPSPPTFNLSQHQSLFQWVKSSHEVPKYWSFSFSIIPSKEHPGPLEWTGWISLQSKGLSRVFSNTTIQKHQFFGAQLSSQSNSHIHTWLLEKP